MDALPTFAAQSGRVAPTVAALIAFAAAVLAGSALRRPGSQQDLASVAVGLGLAASVLGATFIVTSPGGLGTANGSGGAIVACVLGIASLALAAGSRRRTSRRS